MEVFLILIIFGIGVFYWHVYKVEYSDDNIENRLLSYTAKRETTKEYQKASEAYYSHYNSGTVYCGGRDLKTGNRVSREESKEISSSFVDYSESLKTRKRAAELEWLEDIKDAFISEPSKTYIEENIKRLRIANRR